MFREIRNVLIADPQPTSRNALTHALIDAGFQVAEAQTAREIMLQCELDPPDVMIVDVDQPDANGFDVCEFVRHHLRNDDMTLIVSTAGTNKMTRNYLGAMVDYAGGDYYVTKPYDCRLLVRILDTLPASSEAKRRRNRRPRPSCVQWPTSQRHSATVGA